MMKTIQAALAPLFIIGSFCSLNFFEYPLGQLRPRLTYLYFLTTWSLFAYIFYYLVYNSNTSFLYISWFNIIIDITVIISMLIGLFHFKGLKMCLYKLSIVDNTLETLGTTKKYRQLHKCIIRILSGWIAFSVLGNSLDSFWLNYKYFSIIRICVPFVANHLFYINTLNALTWGIILRYTSSKFQQINKHIHVLYSNLVSQRRTETKECKRYMWIIMHVHLQLCHISRDLNKIFNMQMTIQMTSYFAYITELCRLIYSTYTDMNFISFGQILDSIFLYAWAVISSIIILMLNRICEAVYCKANETITILYKLSNDDLDEDLREQILQFTLQIKLTKIKFGSGLFYFGYDFIRLFYKSLATILVIMIQFRQS